MAFRIEIGIDCADPEALAPFWAAALGYELGEPGRDGTYLELEPPSDGQPVVYFQRVPEPKVAKNRLHFDLVTEHPAAEIARLVSLGATMIGDPRSGGSDDWWQVMADPAGNEFCICNQTDEWSE